jgi:hypothetical protein
MWALARGMCRQAARKERTLVRFLGDLAGKGLPALCESDCMAGTGQVSASIPHPPIAALDKN